MGWRRFLCVFKQQHVSLASQWPPRKKANIPPSFTSSLSLSQKWYTWAHTIWESAFCKVIKGLRQWQHPRCGVGVAPQRPPCCRVRIRNNRGLAVLARCCETLCLVLWSDSPPALFLSLNKAKLVGSFKIHWKKRCFSPDMKKTLLSVKLFILLPLKTILTPLQLGIELKNDGVQPLSLRQNILNIIGTLKQVSACWFVQKRVANEKIKTHPK